MTKLLPFLIFLLFVACKNEKSQSQISSLYSVESEDKHEEENEEDNVVYICNGPSSHAYHVDANCYGLTNCSTTLSAVSLDYAIRIGRTPCRFCK